MTIKGKDLIEQIKDKEYSEDLIKELEKYEVKKPKSVWELEKGDVYWRVVVFNEIFAVFKDNWRLFGDAFRILGMIHLTKERAELHARVLNTELAIKKWKRENDNVEFDWEDYKQRKHQLIYYNDSKEIVTDWVVTTKRANAIYFSSRNKIEQCIKDIGKERIIE